MSEGYPYPQFKLAYPAATVTVNDLWEVYPELAGDDKEEFAKQVRDAADYSRKWDAYVALRERVDEVKAEEGATFPDDNAEQPKVVALSPTDRRLLADIPVSFTRAATR